MVSSIDGLVSGLSTSSLISSLMKVEAAPRDRLQTKVSAAESVVSSYMSVNSKLAAVRTASDDLAKLATWRSVKAESSSTAVTASAAGNGDGSTGSVTFDVVALARAQVRTARFPANTDVVIDGTTRQPDVTAATDFQLVIGGAPKTITLGADKSVNGISAAINAQSTSVKATVLTTGSGEKILQLASTNTGVANAFDVVGLNLVDPNTATTVNIAEEAAAVDAELQVNVAGGYTLKSPTNTFTGLISGVTVTASKVETGVTLNVTADVSAIAAKFQAVVDAANATLSEVTKQTAYDPTKKKGSPLTGDFAARQISITLLSTISQGLGALHPLVDGDGNPTPPQTPFGSLSKLGIELTDSGLLSFDAGAFTTAYNKDPDTIKAAGVKFAGVFEAVAKKQTDGVTSTVLGRESLIDSMNAQIENWGVRLNARQESLQRQYTTLETSLSKLNSQSSWLSGQLAGLG